MKREPSSPTPPAKRQHGEPELSDADLRAALLDALQHLAADTAVEETTVERVIDAVEETEVGDDLSGLSDLESSHAVEEAAAAALLAVNVEARLSGVSDSESLPLPPQPPPAPPIDEEEPRRPCSRAGRTTGRCWSRSCLTT